MVVRGPYRLLLPVEHRGQPGHRLLGAQNTADHQGNHDTDGRQRHRYLLGDKQHQGNDKHK